MGDRACGIVVEDPEFDRRVVDMVVGGQRIEAVAGMTGLSIADVNLRLDQAAQQYLTAQSRVRRIYIDAQRLERAQEACVAAANAGDPVAINSLAKLSERIGVLLGLAAPIAMRIDPVELALTAQGRETTTDQLERVLDELQAARRAREQADG